MTHMVPWFSQSTPKANPPSADDPQFNSSLAVEIVTMAVHSLWTNKLRTGLTMLGMVIGISSVVAVTSLGQGVKKATENQIQSLGSDVLLVLAGAASSGGIQMGSGSASTLTLDDARAIAQQVTAARGVTAFLQRPGMQVVYGDENVATSVLGTDLNYPDIKDSFPQEGQFFSETDLKNANPVAVLGTKVRDQLFGKTSPIGKEIRIQNQLYQVIGVMPPKGAIGSIDQDDRVFIPLSNMSTRLVGNNALKGVAITGIWVAAKETNQLDAVQFQVTNLLRLRHDIYPPELDDFRIINQVDVVAAFTSIVSMFTVMIVAIACISLVVGGIGIANIMLVSVVERTREVGLRKALGATYGAILSQFLMEAVMVSGVGGTLGIGLGVIITVTTTQALGIPLVIPLWAVTSGFGISVGVGLVAGVVPARNAAKLDAIVALRTD
ncbi:MAG: ABC transporter permease [Microcystaceae cyanobacterium]